MNLFRKKTKEEKIEKRTSDVYEVLTSAIEFEFTELETVQILNDVRRLLVNSLNNRKNHCESIITANSQKINEINEAMQYLE